MSTYHEAAVDFMERIGELIRTKPDEDRSPIARITDEYFENSYREAAEGLLTRADRLRVLPHGLPSPRSFDFEFARHFKRKAPDGSLVLAEGPIRGKIFFRNDIFTAASAPDNLPAVAVILDPALGFFHPNVSMNPESAGFVCTGALPVGPVPLEPLLMYLITILTYENYRCTDPLNREAARLFAADPEGALHGLEPMEPLY